LLIICCVFIISESVPGKAGERIKPNQKFSDDLILSNTAEIGRPAVQRKVTVVSEDENLPGRNPERKIQVALAQRVLGNIGVFLQDFSVNLYIPCSSISTLSPSRAMIRRRSSLLLK
jgi:hypothetical protein